MTDIQPQPDVSTVAGAPSETLLNRVRIAIVCGSIIATALLYSTHLTSFYHLKVFVLALGGAALGFIAIIARRSPVMRVGIVFWIAMFFFSAIDFIADLRVFPVRQRPHGDDVFGLMLRFQLPTFIALSYPLLAREDNRAKVASSIVFAGSVASVLAIGQYAGVLTFLFPRFPASSPVYSVFGNPGLLGGYIAIALPLALLGYLRASSMQPLLLAALPAMMSALLLSGARTAWLAAAVGCAIVVWKTANPRKIAIAAVLLVVASSACVVLAPEQTVVRAASLLKSSDAGANLRWWFWAGALSMFKENFIAGVDIGHFALESPRYLGDVLWSSDGQSFMHNTLLTEHPHNDFLLVASETGVIGVLFCVWLLFVAVKGRGPEWAAFCSWLVFALFNSPLHSPPHALAGFMLAACLVQRSSGPLPEEFSVAMWGRRLVGALSVAMLPAIAVFVLLPSYRLQRAQQAHIAGQPALQLYAAAESVNGALHAEIDEKYGVALLDAKDYESARKHFKEALKGSDSGSVYLGLGTAQYQLGNKAEAYAALEKAVYRWPSHLNAWRLLVRVCPDSERDAWLGKAARFLRSSEIKILEGEADKDTSQR